MAVSRLPRCKAPTKLLTAVEADPQSWLYLNPAGPSPARLVFGVLRKTYAGRANSALEFGWRKCHLGHDIGVTTFSAWSPNIARVEVILPARADDMLADPATLLAQMDASSADCEKALLVYLTLPLGDVDRVHVGWERVRAFTSRLARERDIATVLALHAPGTVNAPFPLHAHALIVTRQLTGLPVHHGLYDDGLIRDSGQAIVEAMWAEHMALFR